MDVGGLWFGTRTYINESKIVKMQGINHLAWKYNLAVWYYLLCWYFTQRNHLFIHQVLVHLDYYHLLFFPEDYLHLYHLHNTLEYHHLTEGHVLHHQYLLDCIYCHFIHLDNLFHHNIRDNLLFIYH